VSIRLTIALVAALAGACRGGSAPEAAPAPLSYDGSTTISNRILAEALPAFEQRTGRRFERVATSGAGKGLKAMFAGDVSIAGVSRSLTEEELARRPHSVLIGYDALGIFVNAGNPVQNLTRAQLKALFEGKVRSWKELGGADVPVAVCTEPLASERGTLDAIRLAVLGGEPYAGVVERPDPADCLRLVIERPGGVTAATISYAIPGSRWVLVDGLGPTAEDVRTGSYLLARPLLLVTRSPAPPHVQEFMDFMISPDGQKIVGRRFVSIR
jgi:phosphate transport system substrate-binding protein